MKGRLIGPFKRRREELKEGRLKHHEKAREFVSAGNYGVTGTD